MDTTRKYLQAIAATAVVLTVLMVAYTLQAAYNGSRSFNGSQSSLVKSTTRSQDPVPENLFPKELAGMVRVDSVAGQKATDSISLLHDTGIKVDNAYLVTYQGTDGSQMSIMLSDAKDEQAAKALDQVLDIMMRDKHGTDYRTIKIEGKEFKYAAGTDMQDYFRVSDKRVIWVVIAGAKDSTAIIRQMASLY